MRMSFATLAGAISLTLAATVASGDVKLKAAYLRVVTPAAKVLSNLDEIPENNGLAGAQVGISDAMTTGRFLGHSFALSEVSVAHDGDIAAAGHKALSEARILLVDAPAAALLTLADLPEAKGAILLNVAAPEDVLRGADCRANVLHSLPSRRMRADAVMQFAQLRRWTRLALLAGPTPADLAYAQALEDAARKFGLKLKKRLDWNIDADLRRNAAQELPPLTQTLGDYDMLLVADERDDFARYVPFNTWLARPVAGSAGLRPVTWAPVVEQWGAAQLQSRFVKAHGRVMTSRDYAAWAALRAVSEAVTRTNSADPAILRDYMLSDQFALAGFKGRPLSFRRWNGQLRQPIPLVSQRAVVAMAPLPGFLHQHSELDTLGSDAPETQCEAFQ